jgi:glycosyltransferase involved in cell wall biosynthesis
MKVSVVIPVYNEEKTVRELLGRVAATEFDLEIIVIDDCSQDTTLEEIETFRKENPDVELHLHKHDVNQGKGAAIRTGFAQVKGDVAIIQDADLEYDPKDYPTLLGPIQEGKADVVFGSRFLSGPHRVLFFWHYVANNLVTLWSNMLTNLNLTDMETCYKVFRREVIEGIELKSNRFGIEPEITAKVAKGGWRIYEVPISYAGRTYKEGKKITWKDGLVAFWFVLRYRLAD